jgi:superfamily II DNA helicase RecQ
VLDYAQESGRAGRDRSPSKAIIIVQDGNQRAAKDSQDEAEQALVRSYVGESGAARCRRVVLDGYLDRQEVERSRCEEGEERCNVCRGEELEEDNKQPSDNEQPSDVEMGAGESDEESKREETRREETRREETRREFKQQQRERQGPRQTLIQQRQHEFADVK